ncbi:MAG: phosphonate C-P lyase system protein PhnK [Deltaproteobacteria bacterium]|jgi:putative phosphonate transport system ATP-binding protein|nr:phosphonate C-P lyase system protein PhnK [Deltaproteobacteria bacterium]
MTANHAARPSSSFDETLLAVSGMTKTFGGSRGCDDISFTLCAGEVLGIVGESGSGKSTVINCLAGHLAPDAGEIQYHSREGVVDFRRASEVQRRRLARRELGVVHQNAVTGLRMHITAGGNIGERLMANGERHYGRIRQKAVNWLERVEIDAARVDDAPCTFSGGMQQRLQIARCLVTRPRLIFMDEPTTGLDVSVQARLLDILRSLVQELRLSMIMVTHDLAVARLLAHRLMVMKDGQVVEAGLTDQILDDPQAPYTQLLVSSILQG